MLWAEDPADRSLAERWMDFQLGSLWPALRAGFLGLTRTLPEQRDPDAIQLSLRNTAEVLSILDSHLNCTDYVAGESLKMGDVALGSTVYRWLNIDIERPPMPKLEAWHERLASRRAYQKNVMVPFTLT